MYQHISKFALTLILSSLSVSGIAATKVYKTINADGSISYSDEAAQNSEMIEVEPVPTVPAYKAPPSTRPSVVLDENQASAPQDTYNSFTISNPESNSSFNSGSGNITITMESKPALAASHKIKLYLNGELISEQNKTDFKLNNLSRGTYLVKADITNSQGVILKSTSSTFTLHRPSVN